MDKALLNCLFKASEPTQQTHAMHICLSSRPVPGAHKSPRTASACRYALVSAGRSRNPGTAARDV